MKEIFNYISVGLSFACFIYLSICLFGILMCPITFGRSSKSGRFCPFCNGLSLFKRS